MEKDVFLWKNTEILEKKVLNPLECKEIQDFFIEATIGFEPMNQGVADVNKIAQNTHKHWCRHIFDLLYDPLSLKASLTPD